MQVGNQMMATDWASMHREKMGGANKAVGAQTQEQGIAGASFGETLNFVRGNRLDQRMSGEKRAPYSYLADESGCINYNGVNFFCDYEKNRICLGDVSDLRECICVGLSEGGSLVVNRDNLGDLADAIGMFSPEDVNRIMRAIAQDTMCQRKLHEIDEMENGEVANSEGDVAQSREKEETK